MCPESYENKDIRLYKCIQFPLKWELEIKLMENIQAVDTNIFYKNKKRKKKILLLGNVSLSFRKDSYGPREKLYNR